MTKIEDLRLNPIEDFWRLQNRINHTQAELKTYQSLGWIETTLFSMIAALFISSVVSIFDSNLTESISCILGISSFLFYIFRKDIASYKKHLTEIWEKVDKETFEELCRLETEYRKKVNVFSRLYQAEIARKNMGIVNPESDEIFRKMETMTEKLLKEKEFIEQAMAVIILQSKVDESEVNELFANGSSNLNDPEEAKRDIRNMLKGQNETFKTLIHARVAASQ